MNNLQVQLLSETLENLGFEVEIEENFYPPGLTDSVIAIIANPWGFENAIKALEKECPNEFSNVNFNKNIVGSKIAYF